MTVFKRSFIIFLSVLMGLQGQVAHSNAKSNVSALPSEKIFFQNNPLLKKMLIENPYFADFLKDEGLKNIKPQFATNDSALDESPFFMDSNLQNWNKYESPPRSNSVSPRELSLPVVGKQKQLNIHLPLQVFHTSDDYIFLAAETPDFFHNKEIEGVFFVNRQTLFEASVKEEPVPLFFIPLPQIKGGWTGPIQSVEMARAHTLTMLNSQDQALQLDLEDVSYLEQVEKINLLLSTTLQLQNHPEVIQGVVNQEVKFVPPLRGSTMGFGTVFTGVDALNPQKSFWNAGRTSGLRFPAVQRYLKPLFWLQNLFLNSEKAEAFGTETLDPEVVEKLVTLAWVFSVVGVSSFVAKMASPKLNQKLDEIIDDVHKGDVTFLKRQLYGWAHVGIHGLNVLGTFGGISAGHLTNMLFDQFFPKISAGEHNFLRRVILNNSLLFDLNRSTNIPVNPKTFVLGALVFGTVDTTFVALQYAWANPVLARAMYPYVDTYTQSLILKAFDPSNAVTSTYIINETARNGAFFLSEGASMFGLEKKNQILEVLEKEVDAELLSEGKNPVNPEVAEDRNKRIASRLDFLMRQTGLPPQSHFLFDANSIFEKVGQAFGYSEYNNDETGESYILAQRFALTGHVLRQSIKLAKKDPQMSSSQRAEVVRLLEETKSSMGFLRAGIKDGWSGISKARQLRKELSLLSYSGPVDLFVRNIPSMWSENYTPAAVSAAALIFRMSLMSFLKENGHKLVEALDEHSKEAIEKAESLALVDLKLAHRKDLITEPVSDGNLKQKYSYEFLVAKKIHLLQLVEDRMQMEAAEAALIPKKSWLEARQEINAVRAANQALDGFDLDQPVQRDLWRKRYAQSIAAQVGLHFEYENSQDTSDARKKFDGILEQVNQAAKDKLATMMTSNYETIEIMKKLSSLGKLKYEAWLYSLYFLTYYKNFVVEKDVISPLAPEQPGRWQKLRQTQVVKGSKALTRGIRIIEGLHDDMESTKVGWPGFLARWIPFPLPFSTDMNIALKRGLKVMTLMLSVNYLYGAYGPWQLHIPYGNYALSVLLIGPCLYAPSQWLTRTFRMMGVPPMGSVLGKILYSVPYSWVTFTEMLPTLIYGSELINFMQNGVPLFARESIMDPVLRTLAQLPYSDFSNAAGIFATLYVLMYQLRSYDLGQIKNYVQQKMVLYKQKFGRTSDSDKSGRPGGAAVHLIYRCDSLLIL